MMWPISRKVPERFLPKANAIVAISRNDSSQGWEGVPEIPVGIPVFDTPDPHILPLGLVDWV